MKHILFLSFWVLGSAAFASDESVCTSLHRLSCAPGKYDDGTGMAQNLSMQTTSVDLFGMDISKTAKDKLRVALANPENKRFRQIVLSSTGLNASPFCKDATDAPSDECLEQMSIGASDVMSQQFSGTVQVIQPTSTNIKEIITDQMLMMENPIYREIYAGISTQLKSVLPEANLDKQMREKVFPGVKKIMTEKIEKMVSDPKLAKSLIDKINDIQFEGTDCTEQLGGKDTVPGIFMSNAFYLPHRNVFRYCSGFALKNRSEFQMAFTVAHELAHAIDPCGITIGASDFTFKYDAGVTREQAEKQFPFAGVLSCLRSSKSVGALDLASNPATPYPINGGGYYLSNGRMNVGGEFKDFCNKDQITESFADWMAVEVSPEYVAKNFPKLTQEQIRTGYSNVWRGSCQKAAVPGDEHPSQQKRMDTILLAHPMIRKQMGCGPLPPTLRYCELGVEVKDQGEVQGIPSYDYYKTPNIEQPKVIK